MLIKPCDSWYIPQKCHTTRTLLHVWKSSTWNPQALPAATCHCGARGRGQTKASAARAPFVPSQCPSLRHSVPYLWKYICSTVTRQHALLLCWHHEDVHPTFAKPQPLALLDGAFCRGGCATV